MVMNLRSLRDDHVDFCNFIRERYGSLVSFDQGAYIAYYGDKNELLADELNWKPYWGLEGCPDIVHFHGPKPRTALALLTNPSFQPPSPLIREIFEENPPAYKAFTRMWTAFQDRAYPSELLAAACSIRGECTFDYLDVADCPEFLSLISKLNDVVAATGETLEGGVCYPDQTPPQALLTSLPTVDPDHIRKRKNLGKAAKLSTTMLEIGLNGGHSALLLLYSNPHLNLVSVDICQHKYAERAAEFLTMHFPRRFQFFRGDSREVLPRLALMNPKLAFDAIHVDGGNVEDLAYADVSNSLRLARKDALFILDDLQVPWLERVFVECTLRGHIRPEVAGFEATPLHAVARVN
jgi:hypothetical protein